MPQEMSVPTLASSMEQVEHYAIPKICHTSLFFDVLICSVFLSDVPCMSLESTREKHDAPLVSIVLFRVPTPLDNHMWVWKPVVILNQSLGLVWTWMNRTLRIHLHQTLQQSQWITLVLVRLSIWSIVFWTKEFFLLISS